jgi:soluble lytic murein transglycosylase-like protein
MANELILIVEDNPKNLKLVRDTLQVRAIGDGPGLPGIRAQSGGPEPTWCAIGVMQVMPATGRDMKVGDISQIEPNIHAGVKFLRAMMNKYYANEPMDQLNKGLFTFAAYDAGPGRIGQLRKLAAQRGLNPNLWSTTSS